MSSLTGQIDNSGSSVFSSRFLRVALIAIAGFVGTASADAAVFWSDEAPYAQPMPEQPVQRLKKSKRAIAKPEKQAKEIKPVGPLVIAISVDRQTLKLYDANGLFAETKVSTGMRGHTTPMGVFSVIQKSKYHRSNIYSGAPMPFMQRITWSGIALHAGVLPGYPASHGCIRMPMAFATKMWSWTRMGARVVITPGEISPSEFSHPLLEARKASPAPVATVEPMATPKAIAAADASPAVSTVLKSSNETTATFDKRDQTQTADASGAMTLVKPTVSDASPAKAGDSEIVTRRDVDAAAARTIDLATADTPPAPPALKSQETAPEAKKDETRPPDAAKPATPAPVADTAPKRSGQIAVLISRKDSKLYVRQNFAPLFDTPITVSAGERPLGTHIFTARTDKDDAKTLHWTAMSLPVVARRVDEDDHAARRRRSTGAIEVKTAPLPESASAALDRLTVPPAAMAQINEALSGGGSIIVSDLGIAAGGETGQGTDFVVPLR